MTAQEVNCSSTNLQQYWQVHLDNSNSNSEATEYTHTRLTASFPGKPG